MPSPNNLRDKAGFHSTRDRVYCWFSPPGASALALFFLHGEPSVKLFGGALATLDNSPRHLWLHTSDGTPLDEVMACREKEGVLLTVHGGPGVRRALAKELEASSWSESAGDEAPFGTTYFERETLALLPRARGEGAVALVLQAACQGEALKIALESRDTQSLLGDSNGAAFLIDIPRVQLWGPVNAGKSSLLNTLCGRSLAAVGEEPGLTRDAIEGRLQHDGFEFRLFDAPGIWAGSKLDDEALALARSWKAKADLTIELVPPGGTSPPGDWWYHSRVDESGLEGLSAEQPKTLESLKDRLVEHFYGKLRSLPPDRRFALHPELRRDLGQLADGEVAAGELLAKWLRATRPS